MLTNVSPGRPFQPSLMFVSKAGMYPMYLSDALF